MLYLFNKICQGGVYMQKINIKQVGNLNNNINDIYDKIKTFDGPVASFSELPLLNNDDGDIRYVIDEERHYIWKSKTNKWSPYGSIREAVRQSVLQGPTVNGYAGFLAYINRNINIITNGCNIIIDFAGGFGKTGSIDYIEEITSDIINAWVNMPLSKTIFLYINRDINEDISFGYTLLAPMYSNKFPQTAAENQHVFIIPEMKMYVYTQSKWVNVHRVFVGECTTGTANILLITTYAYSGSYNSDWFQISQAINYTKNHNLGMSITDGIDCAFYYSITGDSSDASIAHDTYFKSNTYNGGHLIKENTVQNTRCVIKLGFESGGVQNFKGGVKTSGYYKIIMSRKW